MHLRLFDAFRNCLNVYLMFFRNTQTSWPCNQATIYQGTYILRFAKLLNQVIIKNDGLNFVLFFTGVLKTLQ